MQAAIGAMDFEKCAQLKGKIKTLKEEKAAAAASSKNNNAEIEAQIKSLEKQMQEAITATEFEKCAQLRDQINVLKKQLA